MFRFKLGALQDMRRYVLGTAVEARHAAIRTRSKQDD